MIYKRCLISDHHRIRPQRKYFQWIKPKKGTRVIGSFLVLIPVKYSIYFSVGDVFLAGAFFAGAFLAGAFLAGAFFTGVLALVAGFLAGALAAGFLAEVLGAGFSSAFTVGAATGFSVTLTGSLATGVAAGVSSALGGSVFTEEGSGFFSALGVSFA